MTIGDGGLIFHCYRQPVPYFTYTCAPEESGKTFFLLAPVWISLK